MTFLQALLLGALQGLTEFLPVSSSGHLVLLQSFFGLRESTLLFDLLVHVATLLRRVGHLPSRLVGIRARLPRPIEARCPAPARCVSAHLAGLLIGRMGSTLVVGYLALRWLLRLLMRENFWPFAIYGWLLGIGAILDAL